LPNIASYKHPLKISQHSAALSPNVFARDSDLADRPKQRKAPLIENN
jgi:hypothetical protein